MASLQEQISPSTDDVTASAIAGERQRPGRGNGLPDRDRDTGSIRWAMPPVLRAEPFRPASAADRARAAEVVRRHGNDTLSYFSLRDTGCYVFNEDRTAFLSFKAWHGVAVVGADPIGPREALPDLIAGFLQRCRNQRLTPCFLGISGENLPTYRSLGLRVLKIGEECILRLPDFEVSRLRRKVRRAERHCLALGTGFRMCRSGELGRAEREAADCVSREWLHDKGGSEHGFSMTLGRFPRPEDEDVRVAFAIQDGRVSGFLTFVPVYGTRGWSLDMMRRRRDSPNGLTEFLILQSARVLQSEGWDFISLNFAALSNTKPVPEPKALTALRTLAFERLSWLFQLKSLYTFNDKFRPHWVTRYAAYRDLAKVPLITLAIIQAEDKLF